MKTVLHIATILPFDKLRSNNIKLVVAERLHGKYSAKFICPIPYSNRFLGLFKKKWKMYAQLPDDAEEDGLTISAVRGINFPSHRCKLFSSFTFTLMNISKLRKITEGVDMVHAHYIYPDGFIAYYVNKRYGIPYVLTVSDESWYLKRGLLLKSVAIKICMNAKTLLIESPYARKRMERLIQKPINVVPYGIDSNILAGCFINSINSGRIRIISVGELIKLKHLDLVIRALSVLNEKGYENKYDFRLVGEGRERGNLEMLASNLGVRVRFFGKLSFERVLEELEKSDIFVLPSFPESFGRVYLEAMAKGNAVIGSKDTGVDGLFKNLEEMLFTDRTVDDLAAKLIFLLDNPEEIVRMKKSAFEAVSTRFTWDVIVPEYQRIYESTT